MVGRFVVSWEGDLSQWGRGGGGWFWHVCVFLGPTLGRAGVCLVG